MTRRRRTNAKVPPASPMPSSPLSSGAGAPPELPPDTLAVKKPDCEVLPPPIEAVAIRFPPRELLLLGARPWRFSVTLLMALLKLRFTMLEAMRPVALPRV